MKGGQSICHAPLAPSGLLPLISPSLSTPLTHTGASAYGGLTPALEPPHCHSFGGLEQEKGLGSAIGGLSRRCSE